MTKEISCKEFFIPAPIQDWSDYRTNCRQIAISNLNKKVGQIFKIVLGVLLSLGAIGLIAFFSAHLFFLLPLSISLMGLGGICLGASVGFLLLSKRHLKGYSLEMSAEVGAHKLLSLLRSKKLELPNELKKVRKKTNAPIQNKLGIASKYDWIHYPKKLNGELALRTLYLSQQMISDLLEAAYDKNVVLHLYRYAHHAKGLYDPKQQDDDEYKKACLDTDDYAARFAARILSRRNYNVDTVRLNHQLDILRQTCRDEPKLRCPLPFEIEIQENGPKIALYKRDFPAVDLNNLKKIFENHQLECVESDKTVSAT